MPIDAIIGTIGGGGATLLIARLLIAKALKDLDHIAERMIEIKQDLATIAVKLANHEKDREMLLRHERQIAVLESIVKGHEKWQ